MAALLSTVSAYVCCLTLLVSGLVHAWRMGEFATVLRRQRIVPTTLVQTGALGIVGLELILGAAGLLALGIGQNEEAARPVLAAAAAMYTAYAVYTAYLVSQGRSVPCGCSGTDHPVNGAVVARAAGLGSAAVAAALGAGQIVVPAGSDEFALAAIASIGLTTILWALPAALHDPAAGHAPALVPTPKPIQGDL